MASGPEKNMNKARLMRKELPETICGRWISMSFIKMRILSELKIYSKPDRKSRQFLLNRFNSGADLVILWIVGIYVAGWKSFTDFLNGAKGISTRSHRPPTVINEKGEDTRMIKWMGKNETAKLGIFLYHYSFVFPKQVFTKADYYSNSNWLSLNANTWFSMNFMKITKPYRVYIIPDYPSWLERFSGTHPKNVEQLIRDIYDRKTIIAERKTEDIEKLLSSSNYQLGSLFLKNYEPVDRWIKTGIKKVKVNIRRLRHVFECF